MSYCEDLFERSLKTVLSDNEKIIKCYRPDWLQNPNTGKNLEYDFYIPRLKIAFEIQGQHHYTDGSQINRDNMKRQLSIDNNITLFEVSIFQIDPSTIRRK